MRSFQALMTSLIIAKSAHDYSLNQPLILIRTSPLTLLKKRPILPGTLLLEKSFDPRKKETRPELRQFAENTPPSTSSFPR
jgi:hypothetical protein